MQLQTVPVKYDLIRLLGGLDLVSPTLFLKSGVARDAVNFEVSVFGGYSRIAGYERYDGHASPSAASFNVFTVSLTGVVAVGNTLTGESSLNTAVVIAIPDVNTLVVSKESGYFTEGEYLKVSGTRVGLVSAIGTSASITANLSAQYSALAADLYRQVISVVPGSGAIRGVASYNSKVYAWRDSADGTQLGMYVASASGWVSVPLGFTLYFKTGTAAINVGDTIVGGTSGATAVVTHVAIQSGAWSTGLAAGQICFASKTGTFITNEIIRVGGTSKAVTNGIANEITLAPGGRVDTITANFGKYASTPVMYGVDGANRAFEFYSNGVYVPIDTGNTVDKPNLIVSHKNYLFLTFDSSVQYSALGNPHNWEVVNGAGEIAQNNTVTAMLVQPGSQSTGAMAIYTNSTTAILYGTGSSTWNLVDFNIGTGAKKYTAQNMSASYVLDDRGVMSLTASLNYGNFDSAALTFNIQPWIQQRRNIVTASCLGREKAQYRTFYSDGSGLYVTILNGKMAGSMPVQFPDPVLCIAEGTAADGSEVKYFGSSNGYVYMLDVGTSFDGANIPASLTLNFNSMGSSRILKRYRKASLEISGSGYCQFGFSYDLSYGNSNIGQGINTTYTSALKESNWDSVNWDSFIWDGVTLSPSEVDVVGTAENIAVKIDSNSNYFQPFTINSVILHYSPRRGIR